ncbi:MBL fold metallo-hydrolase [Hwanghaeella grinnelliae]|uniref:MBL fold metallo-hydrolase n=1 Tax=Hwanghaeella grinnelliae TaxID=2500179 RepID=A0A3S2WT05_9PROT|nr:MBL fold metallo-hydrolase [Hwanghaeella grinnelliae]RVU37802.1 MBL fold metallo-hydrolase [Hwanghaeella grinnelliae]
MANIPFVQDMSFTYGHLAEVAPGLRRLVVENPSRFTFHGTGIYVVGTGEVAVVDPGPKSRSTIQTLLAALKGETVSSILVTHTHLDHSPAAAELQELTGAPTFGFGPHGGGMVDRDTVEEGADHSFDPDHRLEDGEAIGGKNWTLHAVHTPGHTSNHMCYAFQELNALLSGDHVMGWSTTVVSPPDGNMADYMASLEKLRDRPEETYWPTHGPAIHGAHSFIDHLYEHRLDRERQVLACLTDGLTTIDRMVPRMYAGIPTELYPAAARSVLAHLLKLVTEGLVATDETPPAVTSRFEINPA